MRRYPSAFGRTLSAYDFYLNTAKEIVIIGADNAEREILVREVYSRYIPNKVVVISDENNAEAVGFIPLLQERKMIEGKATAYVCENFACQQPVTSAEDLAKQL